MSRQTVVHRINGAWNSTCFYLQYSTEYTCSSNYQYSNTPLSGRTGYSQFVRPRLSRTNCAPWTGLVSRFACMSAVPKCSIITSLCALTDPEVTNIDVTGALGSWSTSLHKCHTAEVILIDNSWSYFISLCDDKVPEMNCLTGCI